jgi:hypothetical protein
MDFWYGARAAFDKLSQDVKFSWDNYIEWSKLNHLTELVSVDSGLNEDLVKPNLKNVDKWNFIIIDEYHQTGFYTTADYVLKNIKARDRFNFLTVVKEPNEKCETIQINEFEFVGYDLLDKYYSISTLTNCGGFDETFLPNELNQFGLISDYEKAYDVQKRLLENNPDEDHADCNVIAVWRHKTIGRKL